ncbi:cold shock domain-containing protein [Actinoplanes sp. G11-F43]|uniref:cold shock domain-containing protein n=1 Tax=Actinoplanes sp. G11-F43 TaxID=3424130 RepID=UPI003D33E2A6
MVATSTMTGKVIRFDEIRGYGFVAPDNGTEDVFLHVNDLAFDKRSLNQGTRVQFVPAEGDRGLKATHVQIIETAALTVPAVPAARPASFSGGTADDELCDILRGAELRAEITEALLTSVPTMTAEQIVRARDGVLRIARSHGWTED